MLIDPTGDVYIIDEWPNVPYHEQKSCEVDIAGYADIIAQKELGIGKFADERIIDARYGNRKSVQMSGATIRDSFDDIKTEHFPEGITYLNSYTDNDASIAAGHQAVKELLKYDKNKPISHTNKPKLFVCSNCKNHIHAFLHYAFEDYRDPDKGIKEKVGYRFKDFMDLVRYGVMHIKDLYSLEVFEKKEEQPEDMPIPKNWLSFRETRKVGYGG